MLKKIYRRWLLWNADAIRAEREKYESAGMVGLQYLSNSLLSELECRRKAAALESRHA